MRSIRRMLAFIVDRLAERSTMLAAVVVVGMLMGRYASPEHAEAIATLGTMLAAAIAAGTREGG